MAKTVPFLFVLLLLSLSAICQYQVGVTELFFYDSSRERDIETHIFYPQEEGQPNDEVAEGQFPVVSIGHGFGMGTGSYSYLWEHLVPQGYIAALPATESGIFSVSHQDFGLDLAFVIQELKSRGSDQESMFYGHIDSTSAIMGHSMGGGAAVLGAQNSDSITTLVTLAAAETSPSMIEAAGSLTLPGLTFAGTEDCVTPPPENQEPLFNNLSDCKAYITITGGSHCQFANSDIFCELGEVGCNTGSFIAEEEQHEIITTIITPWLEAWLKNSYEGWVNFTELSGGGSNYSVDMQCSENPPFPLTAAAPEKPSGALTIYPNPAEKMLNLKGDASRIKRFVVYDSKGKAVMNDRLSSNTIDISFLPQGVYFIKLHGKHLFLSFSFAKK